MAHFVTWVEIPASDLNRAIKFYNTIFDAKIEVVENMGMPYAFLPMQGDGISGGLTTERKPSPDGTIAYLNAEGNFDTILGRVVSAGGEVIMPRTDIGPNGIIAHFRDSEGNIVGLHTMIR